MSGRRTRPSEYASWKWRFPRSRSDFPLRRTRPSRNDGRGPRRRARAPPVGRRRSRSRGGPRRPARAAAAQRGRARLFAGAPRPVPVRLPRRRRESLRDAAEAAEKRRTVTVHRSGCLRRLGLGRWRRPSRGRPLHRQSRRPGLPSFRAASATASTASFFRRHRRAWRRRPQARTCAWAS